MPTQEQMARRHNADGTINQHSSHRHKIYGMGCQQFDLLIARSGGACELCGRTGIHLQIDHDHGASRAVRGLICAKCNTRMRYVDNGFIATDEKVRDYLSLPAVDAQAQQHTAPRTLRVPDEVWDSAAAVAAERGESVSDVVRRALARYARRK